MRNWIALIFVGLILTSASAFAAPAGDGDAFAPQPVRGLTLPTDERLLMLTSDGPVGPFPSVERSVPGRDPRHAVLGTLHVLTGIVQGYDGLLTTRVLRSGGVETNPLIKPVAGNQGAMVAIKVAAAVATVVGSESMWRNNHRVGAIVASVVANSAMAMVAHHNSRVLARLQGR